MSTRLLPLIGMYVLVLAASHLVRCQGRQEGEARPEAVSATLHEWDHDTPTEKTVKLSYQDLNSENRSVLVLLHGSPVAAVSLEPLAHQLQDKHRLILPDLPGFGGSTLRIADYSARTYAHNMLELLDALQIESVHVFAYSMGGAVALHMADLAPQQVTSLVLHAAVGVQELELLGDYTLNHAVHGLQLAVLTVLQEGLPHFGWMDQFPFNRYYARNLFDIDQRPLRKILTEISQPTFIIHGQQDFLVPHAAAVEHARLIPQSQLESMPEGDHITVIRKPDMIAPLVTNFVQSVSVGNALTRAEAKPERVRLASEPFDLHRGTDFPWQRIVVLMVLLALATLVTEDLSCIMAGLMVSRGALPFFPATLGCLLGIFIGDMLLYAAGRFLGKPALKYAPLRWILSAERVQASEAFFRRQGPSLIFGTRFVPGTRLPTYFASGMFKAPFLEFAGWFLLAAALWTPMLVALSMWLGGPMLTWFEGFERYALLWFIGVVMVMVLILKLLIPMFSHRGRRLLLSTWRRRSRWEFWPMCLFYLPVFVYVVWLGMKHRCLTLFTASNPGIPESGVVLESKSAILEGFGNPPEIAPYRLLRSGDKVAELEVFMANGGLHYPIVLKPDVGERGSGVGIASDREAAVKYLSDARGPIIAQAYIAGREFGVFYVRKPSKPRGEIISITDKRLIEVTGDGSRTLERLILDDDRAVCMAPFFFKQLAARMNDIPALGERVALTQVGTHCRGALFLDGAHFKTPALEAAIDRLSLQREGFFFGRYDLRVPSEADLMAGKNLRILELNGVTSESTHIYDPKHSLPHAYGALARQWTIAFEIGAENRQRGYRPTSLTALAKLVWRSKTS